MPDARARTPKPAADRRDARNAPLSGTDGLVLSRVDGVVTDSDIASATGLAEEQVQASLANLESLGLIAFDPVAPDAAADLFSVGKLPAAATTTAPQLPLTPEEEVILTEDVDLDVETRRRVLLVHRELGRLDHYALLGVARTADRKTLKRAYFDLAAKFHPDKYFRKKLGSYKLRMEAIFGRITQAHDALTNREARAEYDAYLDEQRRARGIEELLADAMAEVSRATEAIEREARAQAQLQDVPSGPDLGAAAPGAPPRAPPDASSSATRTVDPAVRREALARRLLAGRPLPASTPSSGSLPRTSSSPSVPSMPSAADAMATLRRRYEERKAMAQSSQARKYMASAEAALAANDPVAAANAYRVATTLAPDDADLGRRAREAQVRADAILAETYGRQAGYEEKNDQWADAARSWVRVCRASPTNAHAHERAANALVKSNGDLHEASRLAQRACTLEPENAAFRTTMANVYVAAGLMRNARRELETAAQLAPQDDTIQAMLKRVGKSA